MIPIGTKAITWGGHIAVPVGENTLGRVFNLVGETLVTGSARGIEDAFADLEDV